MSTSSGDTIDTHLVVVDADGVRRASLMRDLIDAGYPATTGSDSLTDPELLRDHPDLLLVDLDDLDLACLAAFGAQGRAPVIGVTGDASPDGRSNAASATVNDFLVRPAGAAELRMRVENALKTARLRRLLADRSARLTDALRSHSAEAGTVRESLSALAAMADYHDDDTDQHSQRVGRVAAAIASRMGLSASFVEMLRDAAPLHDIGKVGISRRILLKPGKLSAAEWLHMQSHVEIGAQILASSNSPVLVLAAEIARHHHERYDGTGYVGGLRGEEIPLSGRIVAVADVWDTLTHDRPYRRAWEVEDAMDEIHAQTERHFDPYAVEAFSLIEPHELAPASAVGAA